MRASFVALLALGCGRVHFGAIGNGDGSLGDGPIVVGDGIPIGGNLAFVSSVGQVPHMFGGLAGADALCNARAQAAGLPGTYVAWLSTSSTNAIDRLAGSRGWSRVDGKPFADTPMDLAARSIFYPLALDELGQPARIAVATGTDQNGHVAAGATCDDYMLATGSIELGLSNEGTDQWTAWNASSDCNTSLSVYCFGIGRSAQTSPPPVTTRRAFVLAAGWTPGNGVASADAACQSEANAAGLNGTFLALLATSSATAISRFSLAGTTWSRLDGVVLADAPTDLAAGHTSAPLDVTATVTYPSCGSVWFGAADPSTVASDAMSCNSWGVNASLNDGIQGFCAASGTDAFDNVPNTCDQSAPVYCLEL